jgi:DNA-3-methyladenine glycosylase
MPRLNREFFAVPADRLARALLGCTLVRRLDDGARLAGVIVETEAYLGARDRAAHSFGNRRTPRTEPMFGPGGTAYVYFTYGMHHCMNIAAAAAGDPQAVLIRALEPVEGMDVMRRHRAAMARAADPAALLEGLLCSGPARLCVALGIDRRHSGLDLTRRGAIWVEGPKRSLVSEHAIGRSTRIGVGYAGPWALRELRFYLRGNSSVSGPRGLKG